MRRGGVRAFWPENDAVHNLVQYCKILHDLFTFKCVEDDLGGLQDAF